eukprot:3426963-Ditylum_brightwellii.AAC.2
MEGNDIGWFVQDVVAGVDQTCQFCACAHAKEVAFDAFVVEDFFGEVLAQEVVVPTDVNHLATQTGVLVMVKGQH